MAYDGYFTFGGTELINAERTKAYVRHALPGLAVAADCCPCEDLAAAAGDGTYSAPMVDPAPWFSPYETSTGDFYGLLPLSVEGIDNGTITATVTELTSDGAVISRPRRTSRSIRFTGLLLGGTDKALDAGMAWLKSVLQGSECTDGDCGGDDLCYLAACPTVCSYAEFPTVVVDVSGAAVVDPANIAAWQTSGGTFLTPVPGTPPTLAVTDMSGAPEISLTLRDLVPGGRYRVNLDLVFALREDPVTVRLPGALDDEFGIWWSPQGSTLETTPPAGGGTGVFEFTSTSQVQRIVVTGPRGQTQFLLRGYQVQRVPGREVMSTMQARRQDAGENFAWLAGSTIASPNLYASAPIYGVVRSGIQSQSTGATVTADNPWLQRTLTGLIPGQTYRVVIAGRHRTIRTSSPNTPNLDRDLYVEIATAAGTPVTSKVETSWPWITGAFEAAHIGWTELEFVATGPSHILRVAPHTAWDATYSDGLTEVRVDYLRVEQDRSLETIEDPDPGLTYRRHLRNVVTVAGPTVTAEFAPTQGAMRQIEFTLVAGDPKPLGDPLEVITVLGPGVVTVPETSCSMGEPILTNWVTNPSFEVSTAGWTAATSSGATVTITQQTATAAAPAVVDTHVGRVTTTTASTSAQPITATISVTPKTAGAAYTASVYLRASVAGTATLAPVLTAGGTVQAAPSSSVSLTPDPAGKWVRASVTYTVPSGTTAVSLQVSFAKAAGALWAAGNHLELDAAQLVDGARLGPYFDGTTPHGSWNGTQGLSTSEYMLTGSALVVDPDCPPLPAPPRPPLIPNICVDTPATWKRYANVIPAQVTSMSPTGLVTVSITAGSTAVRGVRFRMVPNPMGLPIDQVDPCSYCGEFIVTYLPPNTTLTVDGADRSATMTRPGQDPTSAMHLLYGTDGAPISWPELTCGIEYVNLVDVDAADPGALVDMRLSVTPAY